MSDEADVRLRVLMLEKAIDKIGESTTSISVSLQQLTRLEERQAETSEGLKRAFNEIKEVREDFQKTLKQQDQRIGTMEKEMPMIKIARGLVFTFCGGCTILVLMYVAHALGLMTSAGLPH